MLTRKNNIIFLCFLLGSALLLFLFLQYKPLSRKTEPKKQNLYGIKDKTVEVDLVKGEKKFCISYEGSQMELDLKDDTGKRCEVAVNDLFESYPGNKVTEIKNSGKYFLDVKAVGFWQIIIVDAD